MTFSLAPLFLTAVSLVPPGPDCSKPIGSPGVRRVYTNADLERIAACRRSTDAASETKPDEPSATSGKSARSSRRSAPPASRDEAAATADRRHSAEADWRARWRSVDQKVRRLRQQARDLRQEAADVPRDPKKKPTGRRSPAVLTSRALALEAEAREIEDDFHNLARREGALPGWLRAR